MASWHSITGQAGSTEESREPANQEGSYWQCLERAEPSRPARRTKLTRQFPSERPVRQLARHDKARREPFSVVLFPVRPLDLCKLQPVPLRLPPRLPVLRATRETDNPWQIHQAPDILPAR